MFRNVIFDLDGTLLDTLRDLADAGNWLCDQYGWPTHPVDAYRYFVGNGIPTLVRRISPQDHRDAETQRDALARFSARYDGHKTDHTAPYPGLPQLVDELSGAGVQMAVLTNKTHALAGSVVQGYYPDRFPWVQGALPDVAVKPDPTLLHRLMARMGAGTQDTLFVGDSDVDIMTARNAGVTSCGVLWGFRTREELAAAGADHLAEDAQTLGALILG